MPFIRLLLYSLLLFDSATLKLSLACQSLPMSDFFPSRAITIIAGFIACFPTFTSAVVNPNGFSGRPL